MEKGQDVRYVRYQTRTSTGFLTSMYHVTRALNFEVPRACAAAAAAAITAVVCRA